MSRSFEKMSSCNVETLTMERLFLCGFLKSLGIQSPVWLLPSRLNGLTPRISWIWDNVMKPSWATLLNQPVRKISVEQCHDLETALIFILSRSFCHHFSHISIPNSIFLFYYSMDNLNFGVFSLKGIDLGSGDRRLVSPVMRELSRRL